MRFIRNLGIYVWAVCICAVSPVGAQLSDAEQAELDRIVAGMGLDELLGQSLMLGFHAETVSDLVRKSNEGLLRLVQTYRIGSVILFDHNIPSEGDEPAVRQAIFDLTRSLQDAAFNSQPQARKVPLLIAIDQEGGARVRVKEGITRTPAPMYIGATRSPDNAKAAGRIIGSELSMLGINTVLAPVADINNNDERDVVGKRAFGSHKKLVATMSVCFMQGLREGGTLSIAKHYPGHGDAKDDPHYVLPKVQYGDRVQLLSWDLYPFERLVAAGVDGVMTAHLLAPVIDSVPVTISPKALKELRFGSIKFNGIVITDDIADMMGILLDDTRNVIRSRREVVIQSIEAGTDIAMLANIRGKESSNHPERTVTEDEFDEIYRRLFAHFRSSTKRPLLEESAKRVLRQKAKLVGVNEFQRRSAWQPQLDQQGFARMREIHTRRAQSIARDAVVQITDFGNFVNDRADSTLFSEGHGPLTRGRLLRSDDKTLLVVSPAFRNDTFTLALENHANRWFARDNLKVERLIYGWRGRSGGPLASAHWNRPVKLFFERNDDGSVHFFDDAIAERARQLAAAAEGTAGVLFGIVTHAQVKILAHFLDAVDRHLPVIVLLYKEPYLLPAFVYERPNVSVLFAPPFPDESTAVDALFGGILPKTLRYLPFNIPGKLDLRLHENVMLEEAKECNLPNSFADLLQQAKVLYRAAHEQAEVNEETARGSLRRSRDLVFQASERADSDSERASADGLLEQIEDNLISLTPLPK